MNPALESEISRYFTPRTDYVEYGHESPSRCVVWSNMDDELAQQWWLLSRVPSHESHALLRFLARAHHGPATDLLRQTFVAFLEIMQSAHRSVRSIRVLENGSLELELGNQGADSIRVALRENGALRFISEPGSRHAGESQFARALAARLGVTEPDEPQAKVEPHLPGATSEDEDEELVDWDVDFTPPPAPLMTLKGVVTFRGWAPVPEWSEEDLEAEQE